MRIDKRVEGIDLFPDESIMTIEVEKEYPKLTYVLWWGS